MTSSIKPILGLSYFTDAYPGIYLIDEDTNQYNKNKLMYFDGVTWIDLIGPYVNITDFDQLSDGLVTQEVLHQFLNISKFTWNPIWTLISDNDWKSNSMYWSEITYVTYPTVDVLSTYDFIPITFSLTKFDPITGNLISSSTHNHFMGIGLRSIGNRVVLEVSTQDGITVDRDFNPGNWVELVNLDQFLDGELIDSMIEVFDKLPYLDLIQYGDVVEYTSFISNAQYDYTTQGAWTTMTWISKTEGTKQLGVKDLSGNFPSINNEDAWYQSRKLTTLPIIDFSTDILNLTIKYILGNKVDNVTYPQINTNATFQLVPITYEIPKFEVVVGTMDGLTINYDGSPISLGDIISTTIKLSLNLQFLEDNDESYLLDLGELFLEINNEGMILYSKTEDINEYYISECSLIKPQKDENVIRRF